MSWCFSSCNDAPMGAQCRAGCAGLGCAVDRSGRWRGWAMVFRTCGCGVVPHTFEEDRQPPPTKKQWPVGGCFAALGRFPEEPHIRVGNKGSRRRTIFRAKVRQSDRDRPQVAAPSRAEDNLETRMLVLDSGLAILGWTGKQSSTVAPAVGRRPG